MFKTQDGWIAEYQKKAAYWLHDGNPKRPHALLTSGRHSNGFFNSKLVIPDEGLLNEAASDLVELCVPHLDLSEIDRIVGPQTGATKLAELIAASISDGRVRDCYFSSPAKRGEGENKSMVFDDLDNCVSPGEVVLLCEDVLTTGGSVDLTAQAVIDAGGKVSPFVLVLVNRSGLTEANDRKIIALIDRHMPTWFPDECPLCKAGSEAIRPKGAPEWARLNDTYTTQPLT